MSDTVTIAIIAAISPILTIIVAAFIKKWVTTVKKEVVLVANKLDAVHKEINGRMGQLIELTEKSSKAEGKLEEKEETAAKR